MEKEGGGVGEGVKKVFVMEEWGISGKLTGRRDGGRRNGETTDGMDGGKAPEPLLCG